MKYQRLVVGDEVVCPGDIDTAVKFAQLTDDLGLRGKTVLDVGCNTGVMTCLAAQAGAAEAVGIDEDADVVAEARDVARRWFPGLAVSFVALPAEWAPGSWDVVIASAVLHYCPDLRRVLRQLSRVTAGVLTCDVVVIDDPGVGFGYDEHRRLFLPTLEAARMLLGEVFADVHPIGPALSPDSSTRALFRCSRSTAPPATALLVYGKGGSGKTTFGAHMASRGWVHVQLDQVFLDWLLTNWCSLVSIEWMASALRGQEWDPILRARLGFLERMVQTSRNRDIVVEGYDMVYPDELDAVEALVRRLGWTDVRRREIT